MTKGVAKLLSVQRMNYIADIQSAKQAIPIDLRKEVFRDVIAHVTPFALRRVLNQYQKIIDKEEPKECTNSFTTVSGLPCVHRIQTRIAEAAGTIQLDDINPHWRYKKPAAFCTRNVLTEVEDLQQPIDPLLAVHEPAIAITKGRPTGNKKELPSRAELEFEKSTKRLPSQFEQVEAYLTQRSNNTEQGGKFKQVKRRGSGRGRGGEERGRGRGRGRGDTATSAPSTRTAIELSDASASSASSDSDVSSDSDADHASESDAERAPLGVARLDKNAATSDSDNESFTYLFIMTSQGLVVRQPQYGGFEDTQEELDWYGSNPEGIDRDRTPEAMYPDEVIGVVATEEEEEEEEEEGLNQDTR